MTIPPRFQARPEILNHPQIPKPMHGLAPRTIMGKEWWDKFRRLAYASTGFRCAACGVRKQDAMYHKWLEAHELYEMDYPNGKMIFKELVPLCHACHNFIHKGRMSALVDAGEMTQKKYDEIIKHGKSVLKNAGVKPMAEYTGSTRPWEDWRMVFDGNEYPPIHKNFEAWCRAYGVVQSPSFLSFDALDDFEMEEF